MKHIVRKAYWNYEKEEKWLNEMSAKGMALSDYSWCRYVFTKAENNEYIYRIELLSHSPVHPESMAYISFLEENGVECVAAYFRWIYLRKKSSEGAFDIYSDMESKIRHYERINQFYTILMFIEFFAGIPNLIMGLLKTSIDPVSGPSSVGNLVIGCSLILLGLLFFYLGSSIRVKIKKLLREKAIRE